ncbi:MAG: MFS transporter [Cyclobacteriaceae bacterium]
MNKTKSPDPGRLLIWGILLVSFNLRPSITAVGPLIPFIREDLALTHGWAGFLTTLPLLTFATFSLFSAKIGNFFGKAKAIFLGLLVLGIGSVVRISGGPFLLYFGTALTGIGIVICNVLIIPLLKTKMQTKTGWVTGMFSTGMTFMAAIATAVSVPLAKELGWGWRGSLLFWSSLLSVTLLVWWPQLRLEKSSHQRNPKKPKGMWKSLLAWQVSLYMGIQSLLFFTMITWLPDMMIEKGLDPVKAGLTASMMQVIGLVGTLFSPVVAMRYQQQSFLNLIIGMAYLMGFSALFSRLILVNILGIALIGLCMGASISLAYTIIALRTKDENYTAGLSGMAQSTGYFLAALGPLLFGLALDFWQNWDLLIYLMLGATLLFMLFGFYAGREKTI